MNDRARGEDLVRLLDEAAALERAGATWTLQHAAAITGYSVTFLRRSDCPKYYEVGYGAKGKAKLFCVPAEVRTWKADRLIRVEDRYARRPA